MNDELVKRGEGRGPLRGSRIGAATGGRNGDWGGPNPASQMNDGFVQSVVIVRGPHGGAYAGRPGGMHAYRPG